MSERRRRSTGPSVKRNSHSTVSRQIEPYKQKHLRTPGQFFSQGDYTQSQLRDAGRCRSVQQCLHYRPTAPPVALSSIVRGGFWVRGPCIHFWPVAIIFSPCWRRTTFSERGQETLQLPTVRVHMQTLCLAHMMHQPPSNRRVGEAFWE